MNEWINRLLDVVKKQMKAHVYVPWFWTIQFWLFILHLASYLSSMFWKLGKNPIQFSITNYLVDEETIQQPWRQFLKEKLLFGHEDNNIGMLLITEGGKLPTWQGLLRSINIEYTTTHDITQNESNLFYAYMA